MHIGRATEAMAEHLQQVQATQARQVIESDRTGPVAVSRTAAPTGAAGSPLPIYNPVIELLQRVSQSAHQMATVPHPPREVHPEAYDGTPPTPPVVDLNA